MEDPDVDKLFNEAVGKNQTDDSKFPWKYGAYTFFLGIRKFFLGEKPVKKNTERFSGLAETLLSTMPDEPREELLTMSDKLLEQQRMLEDTYARRRLEKWATKVIAWYLIAVLILILINGLVLIFHPIETEEIIFNQTKLVQRGFISDSIMTIILSTTTINIIGLGVIVLKGHFDKNKADKS